MWLACSSVISGEGQIVQLFRLDGMIPARHNRGMLGGTESQFSLTRAALGTRGAQKQIPSVLQHHEDSYNLW
jgi:hypothetical protein